MRYAIVTSIDSKYGNFFIKHWLESLKDNVKLDNIDVIVFDYGLTNYQVREIKKAGIVKIIKCVRDGNVTSLRYRDLLDLLNKTPYEQILMCDGGDLIFQADISNIFEQDRDSFRAVVEEVFVKFEHMYQHYIKSPGLRSEIIKLLKDKNAINGGVVLASGKLFKEFCEYYLENVKSLESYGVDQILINYYLYQHGFVKLDKVYNFMLISNFHTDRYHIKDNKYYTSDNRLINVVHNLGGKKLLRGMYKFGYNTEQKMSYFMYISKFCSKILNFTVSLPFKLLDLFKR